MSHQLLSQQDFFLYVPQICDEQIVPACSNTAQISALDSTADLPADLESWVKIPLAGTVVVYACLWNEQKVAKML
jgi:hypothetical protein